MQNNCKNANCTERLPGKTVLYSLCRLLITILFSNIPSVNPPEHMRKTNQQSKSFVMPRMAKKRLEPIMEVPDEDINKNVPKKVVVLDRCNKENCKYSGNRRREWR